MSSLMESTLYKYPVLFVTIPPATEVSRMGHPPILELEVKVLTDKFRYIPDVYSRGKAVHIQEVLLY